MPPKFMRVWTLALLQIVIVGNLQALPTNALYGFSLPFLYLLASVCFFYPSLLLVKTLSIRRPQTGGAYVWISEGFGAKFGFMSICILWLSNLLWYPSILSLTAVNAAYLIHPAWAHSHHFVLLFSILLFWIFTGINCLGVKISSRFSISTCFIGIILPMLILIIGGGVWLWQGKPLMIDATQTPWLPNVFHLSHLNYLMAVIISLFGLEISAVHAGDVINPEKNFPRSLYLSSIILLLLLVGSELAISFIIPANQLNILSGVLDALKIFFHNMHADNWIKPMLLLVFIGNIGSICAWMLGSTRGMLVGCEQNSLSAILRFKTKKDSPIGILAVEAIIFTIASLSFLVFKQLTDSFWLLLDLASQLTLLYYALLFLAALKLLWHEKKFGFTLWMLLGTFTVLLAMGLGFIPPTDLTAAQQHVFQLFIGIGLAGSLVFSRGLLTTKA